MAAADSVAPLRSRHCERITRKTELPLKNLQKRWCGVYKDDPSRPPRGIPGASIYEQDFGNCNGIPHNTLSCAFQQCRAKHNWDYFPPFRTVDGPLGTVPKRPLDMRYSLSEYQAKYRDPRKPPVWRELMCREFKEGFESGSKLLFQMPHELECNQFSEPEPSELEKWLVLQRKPKRKPPEDEIRSAFGCQFPPAKGAAPDERRWPATCVPAPNESKFSEDKCAKQKTPDFAKNVLGMNWVLRTTQTGATTYEDYGKVKPWHRRGLDPNPCVKGYPYLRHK